MRTIITLGLCFFTTSIFFQNLSLITPLGNNLIESSGLLYINGKLITHTDSGGEPALYEIDTATGLQNRKVYVSNVSNIDWEDICSDQHFIYIGDFGNNQGSRTNLRIFKIAQQDYWTKDTVQADTIQFNYSDQTGFTPTNFTTNFDAEAIISLEDSLYIFTKNWGNNKTYIYPISKNIGSYSLTKTDSINAQGLITGAVCDSANNNITLIGYTLNESFFVKIAQWNNLFSSGVVTRSILSPNSSIQIEGIALIDSTHYFISSESFQTTVAELHILDCQTPTSLINLNTQNEIELYPNPAQQTIYIRGKKPITTKIYSSTGKLIKTTQDKVIDIRHIAKGIYTIHLEYNDQVYFQKILIQ